MTTKAKISSLLGLLVLSIFLCQCSAPMSQKSGSNDYAYGREAPSTDAARSSTTKKRSRPGLGTTWGERRTSHVEGTQFERASTSPASTFTIRYNNEAGTPSGKSVRQPFYDGIASIGVKSNGRYLKARGKSRNPVVIGEEGERYSIEIKNHTSGRIEVVLSVDGLDVLDGKTASTRKTGYVIGPNSRFSVEGFRRSYESVAAFRFGGVDSSYAKLSTGSARNVGVIGMAVYKEKTAGDWNIRKNADPFPGERGSGKFSRPPGRRY